jgi:hypothetical protein
MPFLESDTCAEGVYLFLPGFSSLYDAIHGWMTGRMDGWMEKASRTTTSFTICNNVIPVGKNDMGILGDWNTVLT